MGINGDMGSNPIAAQEVKMRVDVIVCDYPDCGREAEDKYPYIRNWGVTTQGDYCPRHYNPYVAWTPRVKSQLEATIERLYAPFIEQQLKDTAAFIKLMTPKEKP
jgi:hypothetical protein